VGVSSGSDQAAAEAEFSALFDAQHGPIWSFVRRRVNDRAEADDLTSEVFLVAWRRFADMPPADERRLWLFGVARNVLYNHRRSITRQQRLLDRVRRNVRSDVVHLDEPDDSLWRALRRLPDDMRDLLLMRAWDDLAVQDIAVLLECTSNAVSLRLRKARAALDAELRSESAHEVAVAASGTGDEARRGQMRRARNDRASIGHVMQQPTTKGES